MELRAAVTYHHHSGFSVQVGETLLIFDYWQGEKGELPPPAQITRESFSSYSQVFVFVSHAHPDHLDPVIFSWMEGILLLTSCPMIRLLAFVVKEWLPEITCF